MRSGTNATRTTRPRKNALERFTIAQATAKYVLAIEDENGDIVVLTTSCEQLDLMTEKLDRVLDEDKETEEE